jgi:hypothetical protein
MNVPETGHIPSLVDIGAGGYLLEIKFMGSSIGRRWSNIHMNH